MAEAISQEVLARAIELQAQARAQEEAQRAEALRLAQEEAARTAPRGFGGVAQDVGTQLLQGAVGLGQAAYGVGNLATLGVLDRATGFSQNFQQTQQILNSMKTIQTQAAMQQGQQAFDERGVLAGVGEYATNPLLLQDLIVGNLPSLIPGAAAGRAAGTAAAEYATARGLGAVASRELVGDAAERAVLRTTAGQVGGGVNIDAINQIRQAGGDENQQQLGGLAAGVLAGVAAPVVSRLTGAARLEGAAANALPGGAGAAGLVANAGLARTAATGAAREATEEYFQSGSEQLAQNIVTPGQDLWAGVGQQAAVGGLAGGLLGGGMGGLIALRSPRTETSLRATLRDAIQRQNIEQGQPLGGSGLADPVVAAPLQVEDTGPLATESIDLGRTPVPGGENVEQIDLGATPLPDAPLPVPQVEELPAGPVEEIVGAPAPLRSVYDITGRQPTVAPFGLPQMQVEELTPEARAGLLGVIDAQRGRGQLGGTDLFAGQLDALGAFPSPTPAAEGPASVQGVPATQGSLDFNAPLPTWKKALASELGLKPASFRGKAWDEFVAAAQAAGVEPHSPNAAEFLTQVAPQIASDPATAPLFAARLAERYAAPTSAEPQPQPSMVPMNAEPATEEQVTAQTVDQSLVDAAVAAAQGSPTVSLRVTPSVAAELRALEADTVGPDSRPEKIRLAQALGAMTGSQLQIPSADLGYVASALNNALDIFADRPGMGALRKAASKLRDEALAAQNNEAQKANALAQVDAPPLPQEGSVPGSPGVDAVDPTIGIDQAIVKHQQLDSSATIEQSTAEAFMDLLADATNPELLDETFLAIKHHPAWANLSDDQQTEIAEEFDLRYSRVEGGDPGKFNRVTAPVATPIGTQEFANFVARANRARGSADPEVVPLEDVAAFEALTGQAAPQDAAGVFAGGKVYLIRQNLADVKDMAVTLAHERGHHGLAALLGDRLPAVMNRLWTNAATRTRIQGKMKALAGNINPEDGGLRRLAAEEVMADMLAANEPITGDVVSKARAAIENTFARLLGYADLKMTNAEVDAILRDTGAVLRGSSPSALREGEPDHLKGLVDLMGDPTSSTVGDARFSRALGDLDKIAAAADAEGPGTKRTINDITKQIGQGGLDLVKNLGASFKEGGAFSTLLDAIPLNQLVNFYGKLFTDGNSRPLNEFARLKRNKGSDFNKTLTQSADLSYRNGEQKVKTSPLELAKEWENFRLRNPAKGDALNKLQQFSTLYRLWPDSDWKDQSKLNYAEHSFTESDRQAALADLQRLWKSVGPEGQKIFRESQATYTSLWNKRFAALRSELARATGLDPASPEFKQAYGNRIDSALQRLKTGPYSPLQRYGDYLVTVRDAEGKIAWFSGHDTKAEAEATAAQLGQSDFKASDSFRIGLSARTEFDWRLDGISQEVISNLEKVAQDALPNDDQGALREEVRRALVESYLQSLPQQSFLQHANKRKGIDGFTMDAFRGFNDYSIKAARSISSLTYDGQISSKLNELQTFVRNKLEAPGTTDVTKLQRVLNAVKSQHAASLNFDRSPTADALSQGGFLWYMTSPSQLFINSMQTPMVTLPRLAGTYGNAGALRSVRDAMGSFAKSRGDMLGKNSVLAEGSTQRRVLQELYRRGVLDFTLAHDMTGLANGEASAMSGHWRRFMEVASAFMHRSEVFNRQVTALATTELEMNKQGLRDNQLSDEQIAQLANTAEEAVLTTQFDYSQSNKPKLMQGPWRKVIFQFQQYRVNMLAMMAKDIRDGFIAGDATPQEKQSARRALAWLLGTQLAITGAAGSVLAPFAFALADMFRDDDDLLDSRSEFLRASPQWISHGLLAGALDTTRLGSDSLIPYFGERAYAPKDGTAQDTFNYYVMRNIGPWAGLLGGAANGVASVFNGDMMGAAKGLMPAPIRDFYRSLYESQAGAKDARQVVYYDPSVWDTVTGAVGLRSGERREAEELRGAGYQAAQAANTVKQRYLGRLAVGHAIGDQGMISEATADIQTWNAAHPDLGIRASDIKRAVVNRIRAQQNATQFGIPSARPPSESLKQALAL